MKTKVKDQVLKFMKRYDTGDMNTNEFILEFLFRTDKNPVAFTPLEDLIRKWPSIESITRSRRYITKAYGIWKRTKADTEEEYIEEFALNNRI